MKLYESQHCTLYCGDAAEELGSVGTGAVDLMIADPPYRVNWRSNQRKPESRHEALIGDDAASMTSVLAVLAQAGAKCGKSGHVYICGIDPGTLVEHMPRLSATAELIWDKGRANAGNLNLPWGPSFERITFGCHVSDMAQVRRGYGKLTAKKRSGSVLRVPRKNSAQTNRHPTEKPVELMTQLIESSTVVGETVLDPFLGSGSTAVAAILAGRRAIGIELDPHYAEIAVERVRAAEAMRAQMLRV